MAEYTDKTCASLVPVQPHTEGPADLRVTGPNGQLGLRVSARPLEGPTIGIRDPDRGALRDKACRSVEADGELKGGFVEKKGKPPETTPWCSSRRRSPGNGQRRPRRGSNNEPGGYGSPLF